MDRPPPGFLHSNTTLETELYRFRCPEHVYNSMDPKEKGQLVPLAYKLLEQEHDAKGLGYFCELRKEHGDTSWNGLDWIVEQARLGHKVIKVEVLNIPCFYFMQNYPWYMRKLNKGVRLFVGHMRNHRYRCEIWVQWHPSKVTSAPPELKFYGDCDDDHEDIELAIIPEVRRFIEWQPCFEKVFKFSSMGNNVTDTVTRQDAHLLAIAKVLARFPGLVMECHPESDQKIIQANGRGWCKFPFTDREAPKAENPYKDFFRLLNNGSIDVKEYEDGTNKGRWAASEDDKLEDQDQAEGEALDGTGYGV
ncbi:hypothetical protein KCU93_g5533, partial [Aureobasidium melanogenum]